MNGLEVWQWILIFLGPAVFFIVGLDIARWEKKRKKKGQYVVVTFKDDFLWTLDITDDLQEAKIKAMCNVADGSIYSADIYKRGGMNLPESQLTKIACFGKRAINQRHDPLGQV